jgi:hypothetical protein
MNKKDVVIVAVIMAVILVIGVSLFITIKTGFSMILNTEMEAEKEQTITDEDILDFLRDEGGLIGEKDTYIRYDRDIGLFGGEGPKRYVFQKASGSYYYVSVTPLRYSGSGDYCGYQYEADEVFYLIKIQSCRINGNADSMDTVIAQEYGALRRFIVSGPKGSFVLHKAT